MKFEDIINTIQLGDSRELLPRFLDKLDRSKVILVSDPPFNIGYHYNSYKDNLDEDEYFKVLKNIFGEDKCVLIHYPEQLYKFSFLIRKVPSKVISWVYNSNTAKQHRDIAFFGVEPNMEKVRQPYKNLDDKRIIERIENGSEGGRLYDWWEINQVKNVSNDKTNHPCQMPLQVMKNIIGILPDNAIIIDPFAGSGTTCLAVKEMNVEQKVNRKFIGIEIDPEYHKIAVNRLNGITAYGQTSIFTDFDSLESKGD